MAKLKNPLLSLAAKGTVARVLTFRRSHRTTIAESLPIPTDPATAKQLSWRTMYQACTALWNDLSPSERQAWESLARSRHMPGFALWQSQCLRPNPGIYLPLAGGTMQGAIDMDTHKITDLAAPTNPNDAARLADAGGGPGTWTLGKYLLGAGPGNPPTEESGWQVLAHVVLGSAVDYVDFTGLDSDADRFYLLFLTLKNAKSSASIFKIYANTDYTDANYDTQILLSFGSTLFSYQSSTPHISSTPAYHCTLAPLTITRDPSGYFRVHSIVSRGQLSSLYLYLNAIASTASISNITKLRVSVSQTAGMATGSVLTLCKPRTS